MLEFVCCPGCNEPMGDRYLLFKAFLNDFVKEYVDSENYDSSLVDELPKNEILTNLGYVNECCRMRVLSNANTTDLIYQKPSN